VLLVLLSEIVSRVARLAGELSGLRGSSARSWRRGRGHRAGALLGGSELGRSFPARARRASRRAARTVAGRGLAGAVEGIERQHRRALADGQHHRGGTPGSALLTCGSVGSGCCTWIGSRRCSELGRLAGAAVCPWRCSPITAAVCPALHRAARAGRAPRSRSSARRWRRWPGHRACSAGSPRPARAWSWRRGRALARSWAGAGLELAPCSPRAGAARPKLACSTVALLSSRAQPMPHRPIEFNGKPLTIHKAITDPNFNEKRVLVNDPWDYIDLWLKRKKVQDARFYWNQARSFYTATRVLPKDSAPLTAYYSMLNAVKALLRVKNVPFKERHGVSGVTADSYSSPASEKIVFLGGGLLPDLCRHLGEDHQPTTYSLRDLLYNIPYIHRAFNLSYRSIPELFLPIENPRILRSGTTDDAWFCADVKGPVDAAKLHKKLPSQWEQDVAFSDKFVIRAQKRFAWDPGKPDESLAAYKDYHEKIRRNVFYINSNRELWYLKLNVRGRIERSSITVSFAAMHKLSELARYSPKRLSRLFDGNFNWLLSEFITSAPVQFIDEIACEMTGDALMPPWRAG
jgi:hypothetical protein